MNYIDTVADILTVMVLEYLRSESRGRNADSATNRVGQKAEKVSAEVGALEYPGTDGMAS